MTRRQLKGSAEDFALLGRFLGAAGTSLDTFRYFSRRPFEVTRSHLYTVLFVDESGTPTAYGHLDPEGDKVWLGICVAESVRGRGIGLEMMQHLIGEADLRKCPSIWLKVDAANAAAIALYRKVGFSVREEQPGLYLIMERA